MKGKRRCKVDKRKCKDDCSSLDIISALPQPILETILGFLSTKEAAKTSILSKEWRYKWTKISTLKFCLSDVSSEESDVSSEEKQVQGNSVDMACKPFYDLLQIVSSHQGPIHEFTFDMDSDYDSFGLDRILIHLSKNHTIKKLTIITYDDVNILPISAFSFYHLTDLNLYCLEIGSEQTFSRFSSLRSLVFEAVVISSKSLLHLLSNCPSLRRLTLNICDSHPGDRDCNFIQLFECLSMIEHLTVDGTYLKWQWPKMNSLHQELPALFNLKYFCFEEMYYVDGHGLAFLLVLINCSPNLEKIKLKMGEYKYDEEYSIVWEEYSDVWLQHLNELEIKDFTNTKPEMDLVKFILARSPKLKKVSIWYWGSSEKRTEMLEVLLETPRVSPVIIIVKGRRC